MKHRRTCLLLLALVLVAQLSHALEEESVDAVPLGDENDSPEFEGTVITQRVLPPSIPTLPSPPPTIHTSDVTAPG